MFARRRIAALLTACLLLISVRYLCLKHGGSLSIAGSKPNGIILDDLRNGGSQRQGRKDVFPPGELDPGKTDYTRTIVMSSMSVDNVSWVDDELRDLLAPAGPFNKAIYVADDRSAPLHPIKNKGHEAMIYLTYIIDHYDNLSDISIFMHADRWTWHNNEILDNDMVGMLRFLNPERVIREGYMNLRCHWDPGCPNWLLLDAQSNKENAQKHEEKAIAEHWHELFPLDPMPAVLSQPCCGQFALSRERILAIPLQRYVFFRSWIMRTPLDDYRSGRVFEYLWQYIFTGNAEVCPEMHTCYCDGYGMCFGGAKEFDAWFELRYKKIKHESQIRRLKLGAAADKDADKPTLLDGVDGDVATGDKSGASEERLAELQSKVDDMKEQLRVLKNEAFMRGRIPQARAQERGREM